MDPIALILVYLFLITFIALIIIWNNTTSGKPRYFILNPYDKASSQEKCS